MYRGRGGISTDSSEDCNFGAEFLSRVVEYITDNFEITDLYTDEQLANAGKEFIADYYLPEDVFDTEELALWAAENGYVIAVMQK